MCKCGRDSQIGYSKVVSIPPTKPRRKPYETETAQEIAAFCVAILGLAVQATLGIVDKTQPDIAQRLAMAMYEPDSGQLRKLATDPAKFPTWQMVGWIVTAIGLALLFYVKSQRARGKDDAEAVAKSPEGLRGCAFVLHSTLKIRLGIEKDDGVLRVTCYGLTSGSVQELEQSIDYVGTAEPSGVGRTFPVHVGVIGLAARTGEAQCAARTAQSDEDYKKELVEEWGYSAEMAAKITLDRKSFIAVPIMGKEDKVIGIVYADSSIENAFTNELDLVGAAASGFAAYIKERYE